MKDADSRAFRMLVSWWFGAILLILSSVGYVLIPYPLVQFVLVLVGEAGLILIVSDLVEKDIREELANRIIGEVKEKVERVSSQVENRLKQSFDLLDNASHNGLLDALPARRDEDTIGPGEKERWKDRTIQVIQDNLLKCQGILRISGISLLDFFLAKGRQGEFFDILRERAQKGPALEVRVLLMDPEGHGIRLRKHVELGGPTAPLLQIEGDIKEALLGIEVLRQIAAQAGNRKFDIKVRFYSFLPQAYFIITDSALFIEQYHFGPTEKVRFWGGEETSPCTGGRVPILRFEQGSNAYIAMLEHFDLIWDLDQKVGPEIIVRQ